MTVSIDLTDDLKTCFELRRVVFIEEQGVPVEEEIDALDVESLHLLARDGDTPVGTARVYIADDIAKIGRVCVLKSHRGAGLGAALIMAALEVSAGKARTAKLGAQLHALGFYETLGFAATGPVYDDAGIDHRDMVRPL
ncbi:GNAT family N-acetyltransferase [Sulfitobacter aestuariivivens]|uniref:GNAT family N-acetyltransferase n=1 Tax=Sulfitobacter aestuariivivens TaxID=2766981 RepID=A0A927HGH6_9RHOB|nr:GNAT family N-acetyltransferase [Sulfitobacter aestuariivivens]